ncbi:NADP-dependent oxidoreductase [Promicromonospora sp. MS192]|uniref:NADP-dependent oxidoreductase n=1 Tax=Promicromonospora sp. MS192 TaxID=3412684 RepID=UPI003C3048E0
MSRAVVREGFGGPEVLHVRDVAEPHARRGEVRVRVRAVGLNPLDWQLASAPGLAAAFGVPTPSGFGCDLAGVVDEVGPGVVGFAVGDRVYGGVLARAAADHLVLPVPLPAPDVLLHTPEGIGDDTAAALPTPGLTAVAAVDAVRLRPGDTVLIGGAAGGVGVLAAQMARLRGATVLGTASPGTFGFLQRLGVVPAAYGPGLADRATALAPGGISAAIDLFGTETVDAALMLGVPPDRISSVAGGPTPAGVHATGAHAADPRALERITDAILAGTVTVPIAESFPIERVRDAVARQAGRHTHGKIVVHP